MMKTCRCSGRHGCPENFSASLPVFTMELNLSITSFWSSSAVSDSSRTDKRWTEIQFQSTYVMLPTISTSQTLYGLQNNWKSWWREANSETWNPKYLAEMPTSTINNKPHKVRRIVRFVKLDQFITCIHSPCFWSNIKSLQIPCVDDKVLQISRGLSLTQTTQYWNTTYLSDSKAGHLKILTSSKLVKWMIFRAHHSCQL